MDIDGYLEIFGMDIECLSYWDRRPEKTNGVIPLLRHESNEISWNFLLARNLRSKFASAKPSDLA